MKIGIMQPYFLPYIGYFQLIKAVDQYIVCDDLNYINNGWINRNNILIGGEKRLCTIPLKKASQNKLINQIEIVDDFSRLLKTVEVNYAKAPYFKDVIQLVERMFSYKNRCLSNFVLNSIKEVLQYLGVSTPIIISSTLDKDCSLKGKDKIINICKGLGAEIYINAIGGQKLYNRAEFAAQGIELKFLETELVPYKQFDKEFIPMLSILDIMMFNSVDEINLMLGNYILI
nr:WbqC family protein [uncultured Bacteroides sp.]